MISNENTNELTICAKLCQNVTIFYRQELASLFQVQAKLFACGDGNNIFHFIASDGHIKSRCSYAVFSMYWPFRISETISIYQNIIEIKYLKTALIHSIALNTDFQIFVCSR